VGSGIVDGFNYVTNKMTLDDDGKHDESLPTAYNNTNNNIQRNDISKLNDSSKPFIDKIVTMNNINNNMTAMNMNTHNSHAASIQNTPNVYQPRTRGASNTELMLNTNVNNVEHSQNPSTSNIYGPPTIHSPTIQQDPKMHGSLMSLQNNFSLSRQSMNYYDTNCTLRNENDNDNDNIFIPNKMASTTNNNRNVVSNSCLTQNLPHIDQTNNIIISQGMNQPIQHQYAPNNNANNTNTMLYPRSLFEHGTSCNQTPTSNILENNDKINNYATISQQNSIDVNNKSDNHNLLSNNIDHVNVNVNVNVNDNANSVHNFIGYNLDNCNNSNIPDL